jgi:hypothetical protein
MAEMSPSTPHPATLASEGAVLVEVGRVPVERAVTLHVLGRVAACFALRPSGKRSGIRDGGRRVRRRRDRSVLPSLWAVFPFNFWFDPPHMLVWVVVVGGGGM